MVVAQSFSLPDDSTDYSYARETTTKRNIHRPQQQQYALQDAFATLFVVAMTLVAFAVS